MDNEALTQYYRAVFPAPPAPKTPGQKRDRLAARRRAERARRCCARLFERESDTLRFGAAGTLWTAYNSVTEYVDHVAPSRVNDPMRRLQSMWFGKGSALKALAYRRAMHWLRRSGTGAALP